MFNKKSFKKNQYMLDGIFAHHGYDWWWHSFTAINKKTGENVPFFIEFFIINPNVSPNEIILGQKNKGKKPSYLMVKCGCWGKNKVQLNRFFKISDVVIKKCPIEITAGDCYLSEFMTKGIVEVDEIRDGEMSDKGKMSWDLKIDKLISYDVGYGTNSLFRDIKAFEMYWHVQGMKSQFEGQITLNDEEYECIKDQSYGYQDKNWGWDFTSPWVWLSSNNIWDNEVQLKNSAFDIGGGRPKAFNIRFNRKLLGAYYIEGKEYEFNFSKFLHPSKTAFSFKNDDEYCYWKIIQGNKSTRIITKVKCKIADMIFINYEAPNGLKLHNRLYNGGNGEGIIKIFKRQNKKFVLDKELKIYNVGCEYGEYDK